MHELSVCLALIQQVERIAADRHARGVVAITVIVGPLSGIEAQLLRNAYPMAAAGTLAADAVLLIQAGPVVVNCTRCGADSEVAPNRLLCGECGDFRTRIVSGEELTLKSVELELPADAEGSSRSAG